MQWEYLVKHEYLNEKALDELGEDEWELVSIFVHPSYHTDTNERLITFYFKRPFEYEDDDENGDTGDE